MSDEAPTSINESPTLDELLVKAAARKEETPSKRFNFLTQWPWRKSKTPRSTAQPLLPSGLNIEEVADLTHALVTAVRRLARQGQILDKEVALSQVSLSEGPAWQVQFDESRVQPGQSRSALQQRALTGLLYNLVVGRNKPFGSRADLRELETLYPATASVLKQAFDGSYQTTGEMAGAFGWSLYQRERFTRTAEDGTFVGYETENPRKPAKNQAVQVLEDPVLRSTGAGGFSIIAAWASLGIGMLLLFFFIIYSVVNSSNPTQVSALASPSPTVPPTATPPGLLENTHQNDGSTLTRYQAAYANPANNIYTPTIKLAPGEVTSIGGPRKLMLNDIGWAPGQNLYLSTSDGGWEVWDLVSKTRISRKELPNSDLYVAVSWSPNGQNFAAIGFDGQLKLGTDGKILHSGTFSGAVTGYTWQSQVSNATSQIFKWSPNSNYLLLQGQGALPQVWGFDGGPQQINTTNNNANSRLTGQFNTLGGSGGAVFVWSADSNYIATVSNVNYIAGTALNTSRVLVFRSKDLAAVANIDLGDTGQTQYVNGEDTLAWSPDNKYMAMTRWQNLSDTSLSPPSGELLIWQVPTLNDPGTPRRNFNGTPPFTFSGTPNISTTRRTNGFQPVQAPESAINLQTIPLSEAPAYAFYQGVTLAWSPNNELLVIAQGASMPVIQFYGHTTPAKNGPVWGDEFDMTFPQAANINLARWSPDGKSLLINDSSGTLSLYNIDAPNLKPLGLPKIIYQGPTSNTTDWVASSDGKWVATTDDSRQNITIVSGQTGQNSFTLSGPALPNANAFSTVQEMKWSQDNQYLAVLFLNNRQEDVDANSVPPKAHRYEGVIQVWDFQNNKVNFLADYMLPNDSPYNTFDWDTSTATPGILFEIGDAYVGRFDLTQSAPSLDVQRQYNWDITTGGSTPDQASAKANLAYTLVATLGTTPTKKLDVLNDIWAPNWQVVFRQDNSHTTQDQIVKVFTDTSKITPNLVSHLQPDPNGAQNNYENNVGFSPDGKYLAIGLNTGLINIYQTADGKLAHSWSAHQGVISSVVWSADGKSLASGATDRTVKVWDTTTWRLTQTLRGLYGPVSNLQWQPDNQSLMVNDQDDHIMIIWKAKA